MYSLLASITPVKGDVNEPEAKDEDIFFDIFSQGVDKPKKHMYDEKRS